MNLSYLECYQILNISDDCDWLTFRKKYKALIQYSHPDRFEENSANHTKAKKNTLLYNAAYKSISDYYKVNHRLPIPTKHNIIIEKDNVSRKKRPSINKVDSINRQLPKKTPNRIWLAGFPIIFIGVSFYIVSQTDFTLSEATKIEDHSTVSSAQIISKTNQVPSESLSKTIDEPVTKPVLYIHIGSNIGDVISIQGKPTSIEGNTWYYGKSSILFTNSLVSDWSRHSENPLHVEIKYQPILNMKMTDNGKTEATPPPPYWYKNQPEF